MFSQVDMCSDINYEGRSDMKTVAMREGSRVYVYV